MKIALTPKMLTEIHTVIALATRSGALVRVYAEAEKIRLANIFDNVALEDILDELVVKSAMAWGFESDPLEARDAFFPRASKPILRLVTSET